MVTLSTSRTSTNSHSNLPTSQVKCLRPRTTVAQTPPAVVITGELPHLNVHVAKKHD